MGNVCSPSFFKPGKVRDDSSASGATAGSAMNLALGLGLRRRSSSSSKDKVSNSDQPLAFPRENKEGLGLVGLRNLGNTCYFNSAVQCLSNTVAFADYFLQDDDWKKDINKDNPNSKKGEFALSFGNLASRMWTTKKSYYKSSLSPENLFSKLVKHESRFEGANQHDVQELISTLLDGIHEDLNKVKKKPYVVDLESDGLQNNDHEIARESWRRYLQRNKSIVVDIFQGQLKTTLKCLTCGKIKIKFDPFMYLTLPIPQKQETSSRSFYKTQETPVTIYDCLDRFNSPEEMKGVGAQWMCPGCKDLKDSLLTMETWKTPHVLIIHLKRFVQNSPTGKRKKINTFVEFGMELNMTKYIKSKDDSCIREYELYAISNHHGSLNYGHYTCFAKNRINNKWYFYDDTSCSEVSEDEVETPSAYVLFYCSKDTGRDDRDDYSIYGNLNADDEDNEAHATATTTGGAEINQSSSSNSNTARGIINDNTRKNNNNINNNDNNNENNSNNNNNNNENSRNNSNTHIRNNTGNIKSKMKVITVSGNATDSEMEDGVLTNSVIIDGDNENSKSRSIQSIDQNMKAFSPLNDEDISLDGMNLTHSSSSSNSNSNLSLHTKLPSRITIPEAGGSNKLNNNRKSIISSRSRTHSDNNSNNNNSNPNTPKSSSSSSTIRDKGAFSETIFKPAKPAGGMTTNFNRGIGGGGGGGGGVGQASQASHVVNKVESPRSPDFSRVVRVSVIRK